MGNRPTVHVPDPIEDYIRSWFAKKKQTPQHVEVHKQTIGMLLDSIDSLSLHIMGRIVSIQVQDTTEQRKKEADDEAFWDAIERFPAS